MPPESEISRLRMIKRLKWNVLHGGGGGEESDGGLSSSDDSEAGDVGTANELLARLIDNDPDLRAQRRQQDSLNLGLSEEKSGSSAKPQSLKSLPKHRKSDANHDDLLASVGRSASSSDEEDAGRRYETNAILSDQSGDDDEGDQGMSAGDASDPEVGGTFWRECDICPGKRFLHDREVQDHLNSKGHARALKALERSDTRTTSRDGHERRSDDVAESSGQIVRPAALRVEQKEPHLAVKPRELRSPRDCGAKAVHNNEIAEPNCKATLNDDAAERKALKRKAAVKMKLKRLKKRKWEREHGVTANATDPAAAAAPHIDSAIRDTADADNETVQERIDSARENIGRSSTRPHLGRKIQNADSRKKDIVGLSQASTDAAPVANARRRLSWSSAIDSSGPGLGSCEIAVISVGKKTKLKRKNAANSSRKL
jgi:hypothetical protein